MPPAWRFISGLILFSYRAASDQMQRLLRREFTVSVHSGQVGSAYITREDKLVPHLGSWDTGSRRKPALFRIFVLAVDDKMMLSAAVTVDDFILLILLPMV